MFNRLSFGGGDAEEFMLKLMQTKYPTFPSRMSSFQARVSKINGDMVSMSLTLSLSLIGFVL
jgi:actin-related protein